MSNENAPVFKQKYGKLRDDNDIPLTLSLFDAFGKASKYYDKDVEIKLDCTFYRIGFVLNNKNITEWVIEYDVENLIKDEMHGYDIPASLEFIQLICGLSASQLLDHYYYSNGLTLNDEYKLDKKSNMLMGVWGDIYLHIGHDCLDGRQALYDEEEN